MAAMRAKWLASGLIFSGQVHGHFGDRIIPILEITDEMLAQIELDGLIDEWPEVYGEPTLTPLDFTFFYPQYDPADLDFRIWLGWHDATDRIYVGAVFFDDAYWTDYKEVDSRGWWDEDSMQLEIDGDHSGGNQVMDGYSFLHLETYGLSQPYEAIARIPVGPNVGIWGASMVIDPREPVYDWMVKPPYSEGSGGVYGENPTVSVIEFYVSPFDAISWDDPNESIVSDLQAGKVIGLDVMGRDVDPGKRAGGMRLAGGAGGRWADAFADGLLISAADSAVREESSAMREESWGWIKASLAE